ncbi:MAG: hypothetical protein CMJ59_22510 [Planctomycetaceae bacterium]|nr:hypothetical protein [Planctomycetaceae bacterium]
MHHLGLSAEEFQPVTHLEVPSARRMLTVSTFSPTSTADSFSEQRLLEPFFTVLRSRRGRRSQLRPRNAGS